MFNIGYFVHPQIRMFSWEGVRAKLCLIKKPDTEKLIKKSSFYFPGKQFVFTDMGRSAFKLIIEKANLANSRILLSAYICDIFYPILKKYNIQPIFLDIDLKTFNIKVEDIKTKIDTESRAILLCHTYGLPVDTAEIRKIVDNRLLIIEDCAHSFGAKYSSAISEQNEGYTGNSGDVSFFSLYKQFPALRGGLLVCPKDWQIFLSKTSFNFRDFLSFLNCFPHWAFLFKKFGAGIAPKMLRQEKSPKPAGINRVSLNLFAEFLNNFERLLENRKNLALIFQKELNSLGFEIQESRDNVFCYLSALVPKNLEEKRDEIVKKLRQYRIFCTRIWHAPIILNSGVQKEYNLDLSEYPNTLEAARRIINFPLQNYYTENDIESIIASIKKVLTQL